MQLSQSHDIPVPVHTVWEALNDAEILAQAIPGCEGLEKISDTQLSAKVKLKIGPVSATFTGEVTLSDLAPPHAYVISGSGKHWHLHFVGQGPSSSRCGKVSVLSAVEVVEAFLVM